MNLYNRIAGQSLERLSALSDGVFAIALTILVLDLHVPVDAAIHTERDLWSALAGLGPDVVTYVMSFLTLGIFWIGQQTQLNNLVRADRKLAWVHLLFLLAASLTPFSTALLAQYITFRLALVVYWLNIFLLGATLFASWRFAKRANLIKPDAEPGIDVAVERRIVQAQALYAFGALLCVIDTYVSIAFIVLVQLNYAIAPRWRRR